MIEKHIIERYSGQERGPLFIVLSAMHGNEPAGVEALKEIFKLLHLEPSKNPNFSFKGQLLGLLGNTRAFAQNKRFIVKDLNRQWTHKNINRIKQANVADLDSEDMELKELLAIIEHEIDQYQPEKIVLLDLHTTTAYGGIFSIATDDIESIRIAIKFHAPVIRGLLAGIKGTTLHYFNDNNFTPKTIGVCFESGQHQEALSINRAVAAIINCMRSIGCVKAADVENKHDQLLIDYSRDLPKVTDLIYCHSIRPGDNFRMAPNYTNFQAIKAGEVLAHDKNGEIKAATDGLILMPLYQKQGDDGFFLIKTDLGFI